MEPLAFVWLTSIVGAGAFSSAGYLLGQRTAAPSPAKVIEPAPVPAPAPAPKAPEAIPALRFTEDAPDEEATRVGAAPDQVARSAVPSASHHIAREQIEALKSELETVRAELAAARVETQSALERARVAEAAQADFAKALAEAKAATEKARAGETAAKAAAEKAAAAKASSTEAKDSEIAKQLEVVRSELRNEVVARATADARADELADRLAKASEETASLRHKLAVQVRSTGPTSRRPSIEPPNSNPPRVSAPPRAAANDETAILQAEVARLAADNRELRARLLSSIPPKRPTSRASAPDLDLDLYNRLVERLAGSIGTRCAVIADEVGSLLAGSGDLAEGLAAFGAYIRDASARTERLLPLEGVEEIDIRDRNGSVLSTRVLIRSPAELSLVVLGKDIASIAAAKKVTEETLRVR